MKTKRYAHMRANIHKHVTVGRLKISGNVKQKSVSCQIWRFRWDRDGLDLRRLTFQLID